MPVVVPSLKVNALNCAAVPYQMPVAVLYVPPLKFERSPGKPVTVTLPSVSFASAAAMVAPKLTVLPTVRASNVVPTNTGASD